MNQYKMVLQMLVCGTVAILSILGVFLWLVFHFYRNKMRLMFEQEHKEIFARMDEGEIMMSQISKEVHDNIGQISSMVMMHLRKIKKMAASAEQLQIIEWAMDYAEQLVNNAHHISHSLNSDYITQRGLYNVIGQQLDRIKKLSNVETFLTVEDDGQQLLPEHALVIYRIVQEALGNIVKHASASSIEVSIFYQKKIFRVTITDNGKGMDDTAHINGGIGLINMQQRAKILNGELTLASKPGLGCMVSLSINQI